MRLLLDSIHLRGRLYMPVKKSCGQKPVLECYIVVFFTHPLYLTLPAGCLRKRGVLALLFRMYSTDTTSRSLITNTGVRKNYIIPKG